MKKSIILIFVLALIAAVSALSFTGCGNTSVGGGETGETLTDNKSDDITEDKENADEKEDGKGEDVGYKDPHDDGGWTGWQK